MVAQIQDQRPPTPDNVQGKLVSDDASIVTPVRRVDAIEDTIIAGPPSPKMRFPMRSEMRSPGGR